MVPNVRKRRTLIQHICCPLSNRLNQAVSDATTDYYRYDSLLSVYYTTAEDPEFLLGKMILSALPEYGYQMK